MDSNSFETVLVSKHKCYFITPSLFVPGVDKDAEYISPEDMLKIFDKDSDALVKCIRKRSEQAGAMTYYVKQNGFIAKGYFRVNVPTGTGAMELPTFFKLKQLIDTIAIRLGIA